MMLLALALLASAQTDDAPAPPPRRIVAATVYGDDPCPRGQRDEIVVCARQPEADRHRIPKRFRDLPNRSAAAQAWTARMATVDEANRVGLPNSCSPVGAGGQSGCTLQMLQQWKAEQQAAERAE